jgi:tetrapyrrole methylase family protein/MazG family protein
MAMKKTPKKINGKPAETRAPKKYTVPELLGIMARLRGPEGCPWDREQTKDSLKKFLVEETYEVLEAIEAGSPAELQEELGDLLLQILFQARIAEEKGHFNFLDVVHTLGEKLVRRHPHVFPPAGRKGPRPKPQNAREVLYVWGAAKEREGKYRKRISLLDGLPYSLPALERAQRISQRVSRVGFDWPNLQGVWEKVQEETAELQKAAQGASSKEMEAELGDLFFTLVNWARFQGIAAEEALRKANRRFTLRFSQMERELKRRGRKPEQSTLEEMNQIWGEVKKEGLVKKGRRGKGDRSSSTPKPRS